MSSLRDRSNRLRPKSRGKYISFFGVLGLLVLPIVAPQASATPPQATVGMYLDQPFVQGSYVAEEFASETTITTFNEQSYGNTCSFNGATVEALYFETPNCFVRNELNFGGASTTSSTPSVGTYPEPAYYGQVGSGGASIVFNTPQTYVGLWWSAGSAGNEIQLFDGSNMVANVTANDVAGTLYSPSPLSALDGSQYSTSFYIGNPVDWHELGTPVDFSNSDAANTYESNHTLAQEPFVYIHFIAEDGVTFDRVNLVAPGNGFEFDNFTTSSATGIRAAGIPTPLVLQRQLYAPAYVDFDANGGTGSLPRQYSVDNNSNFLSTVCLDYEDPTHCISADSYTSQFLGWSDSPNGTGNLYGWFFSFWGTTYTWGDSYPFTESKTVYAQWRNTFSYKYLTYYGAELSAEVTGNIWDYIDYDSQEEYSVDNFADITLPSDTRPDQYLEGWYTFASDGSIVRVGSPGDVIQASSYKSWDSNVFGHWVDNPPPPASVDALTPQVLLVYPRATSVQLPSMPLTGESSASICLVESDSVGNQISSDLQFTDLSTASSGFSSSYLISANSALISNTSRYIRVSVSLISDPSCSSGFTHVVEVRPLGAKLTQVVPLNLTAR